MDAGQFSVHVLKCPFGVREVRLASYADAATGAASSVSAGDNYAHVSSHAGVSDASLQHYAVAGTRGIQQLVATTRGTHGEKTNEKEATHTVQPDMFSMHEKVRLLLWDSQTSVLVAARAFNPAFTVHRCAVAGSCVYATLEGSPDTAGAEEETCVYAWDRHTLQPVTVLRGHEARLTALAVAPQSTGAASADVVLATASLDGTVRLWRHHYDSAREDATGQQEETRANPAQALAVLPATELGVIKDLRFLAADLLVAACSKCALAFVRFPSAIVKAKGRSEPWSIRPASGALGLKWQLLRSTVDPDGSTTTLHVSPPLAGDPRKISVNGSAAVAARPASPLNDTRRKVNILTGSTSGYIQEWVIETSEVDGQPSSPQTEEATSLTPAAGVLVRGRWHHKAHAATVNCIATDDDIAVSTSIFDGARIYHRRAGATCVITTAAVVPVLVPQLKQLIWGAIDGTLSVASYSLFASGAERELQRLWTAKPHAAAIRGVCLSLTPGLQWGVLCVGAANGSISVWRPAPVGPSTSEAVKSVKASTPLLSRVLDMYVAPSSTGSSHRILTVVGLKRGDGGYALAAVEMHVNTGTAASLCALPPLQPEEEVTCARLCCGAETHHKLLLLVGTRSGQLVLYLKESQQSPWRALGPSKWCAEHLGRRASITAISPLRPALDGAFVAVTAHGHVGASLAMQSVFTTVLHTCLEEGVVVVDEDPYFQGSADVPAPAQGSLVSVLSSSNHTTSTESIVGVAWMSGASDHATQTTAAGNGLVVWDSRGMLLRCRCGVNDNPTAIKAKKAEESDLVWSGPEVIVRPSSAVAASFCGVARNLDGASTNIVLTDSSDSDILCVNVTSSRKRVLMKAAVRITDAAGLLCDVGTTAVRFAAVRSGNDSSGMGAVVALYDDLGREQYRVTREGACVSCTHPSTGSATKTLYYAPLVKTPALQRSPSRSPSSPTPAACTLLAASAVDRLLFVGYDDGLFQMVDTTDMFVFVRTWARDDAGTARGIREVFYANSVALVRLAGNCLRVFVVPPRSILDQPIPL